MQLSMGFNQDEYYPEVDASLVRLEDLHSPLELRRAVWEVFKELFAADEDADEGDPEHHDDNVGAETRFDQLANDIWQAYENWQSGRSETPKE